MLKGSILTSGLNSKRIPFLQNTLTISQTLSGPSILMVYYATSDASMFQTPAISDYVFFSTCTTTPLQVISVRQRPYIKSVCNIIGPNFQSTSRTTANCSHAKPVRHKPYGLLKQLPIPEKPWNSISMDFIEKLPPSSGYT